MKNLILMIMFALIAQRAGAIIPVFVDFDATWPLQLEEWVQQIEQATQTVEQAKNMVAQTKTLVNYAGNPRAAVSSLTDISGIVSTISRLSDSSTSADSIARTINAGEAMVNSVNRFRTVVGGSMDVFGTSASRDPSLYQATLTLEGVVNGTKQLIDGNRRAQQTLTSQLAVANARLHSATTQSQVAAAQADIARLQSLIQQTNANAQNALADYQLMKEQKQIAEEDAALRQAEKVAAASKTAAQKAEDDRKQFNSGIGAGLGTGSEVQWNTSTMFQSPFSH